MKDKIYNLSPYPIKCLMASIKGYLNNKKRYNIYYNSIYSELIKNEVLKDLGIQNSLFYSLPSLLKGFIPTPLMKLLRKKRMKK